MAEELNRSHRASPDVELKKTLQHFARDFLSRTEPMEAVSVQLRRQSRFTHEGITAKGHSVHLDEPREFGGTGRSPDPAEHLLAAVGSSLSVTLTAHAALRDIPIESLELRLQGRIDGRSFFDPRAWPGRGGVRDITIELTLVTPAPRGQIAELLRDALRASPVVASLKKRPHVRLRMSCSLEIDPD